MWDWLNKPENLRNENIPMLCGPGCACGKQTITSKLKIVIMLIVLAAVAIALIYRRI